MNTFSPDLYVRAAHFAALAHGAQKIPGGEIPYIVHPCSVVAEVPDLAVACGRKPKRKR